MAKTSEKSQMDEFERLLEESFTTKLNVADVVKGVVVKAENDGFLVDIGAKSEGFLPQREIPSSMLTENPLKVGDQKEFYILREDEKEDGGMLLSLKKLLALKPGRRFKTLKFPAKPLLRRLFLSLKAALLLKFRICADLSPLLS